MHFVIILNEIIFKWNATFTFISRNVWVISELGERNREEPFYLLSSLPAFCWDRASTIQQSLCCKYYKWQTMTCLCSHPHQVRCNLGYNWHPEMHLWETEWLQGHSWLCGLCSSLRIFKGEISHSGWGRRDGYIVLTKITFVFPLEKKKNLFQNMQDCFIKK